EERSSPLLGLVTPFHDKRFQEAYINAVVRLDLTFRQAASPELREVIFLGGPMAERCLSTSDWGVGSWIKQSFEDRRSSVRKLVLAAKSKVHFSIDTWTYDEGNKRAYLAVNSHFLGPNGTPRTALLSFRRIIGTHSGENMAQIVRGAIEDYNIQDIGYFILDNAKNNEIMLKELAREVPGIEYPACHVRCIGHIINLVVKAILLGQGVTAFKKDLLGLVDDSDAAFKVWSRAGPLGKLHNICVFVNRSSGQREEFERYQMPHERYLDKDCDPEGGDETFYYVLLIDQGVRWSSAYYMIKRAIHLRATVDRFLDRYQHQPGTYDIRSDRLSPQDWAYLERLFQLLRPFKGLTQYMEGKATQGTHGAVWESLKSMGFLYKHSNKRRIV
ncbi:Ribonuclease H-like protein, partial [Macrophomina phaseolina MS6]